jgi:signal transduction histidine kinase
MASYNWFRNTSFRTGMIYAMFFLAAVLAIFGATYWSVRSDMRASIRASVEADMAHILSEYRMNGLAAMKEAVDERLAETQGFDHIYMLTDLSGKYISGNLAQLPVFDGKFEGEVHVAVSAGKPQEPLIMAAGETLNLKDAVLFVGRNATQMDETLEILLSSLAMGTAITAAAALLLGIILGLYSTRRVEQLGHVTRSVVNSGLKDRLPRTGTGDEFDRLSSDINIMLDRIQELMVGMQQISNDIAHELRTPLSKLRNGLEGVLTQRPSKISAYRASISQSIDETDAIVGTFNALLRIAQIEGGARRSNFRNVDLSSVAQDIFEIYQPVACDSQLSLSCKIAKGIVVLGDSELLTQLLSNLVENAIRYVPGGGHILLSLIHESDQAVLTVSDNGPGIPKEEFEKVFQRLYRVEQSRTSSGSGLGLSLALSIAKLHSATIALHDNAPGLAVILKISSKSSKPNYEFSNLN